MSANFETYVRNALRAIYFVATGLIILLNIIDVINLNTVLPGRFYLSILVILILLVALILYFFGKLSLQKSYGVLAYTILLSTIMIFYLSKNQTDFPQILLRNSLMLVCAITLSAFALNRIHVIIVSTLFLVAIVILTFITDNPFVMDNIPVIVCIFLFYVVAMYYFINMRDRYIKAMELSDKLIKTQNEIINSQSAELKQQSEEIAFIREWMDSQTIRIKKESKHIVDNLVFARNIQNTILPKEIEYLNYLPDSFILHISKDEISGDFYWIREKGGKLFIAAVDCTGHGVSGALVSMIGFLSLNRAIAELNDPSPADILNKLDSIFQTEFNRSSEDFNAKIGLDIALVSLDMENRQLEFSGAFNPLYVVRKGELIKIKANHYMLGIEVDDFFRQFENHVLEIQPGDSMYIFSDGFPDQFGGPSGKKFSYDRLRKALIEISDKKMEVQRVELRKVWEEWKGSLEQTDDILLLGFRL